jgi:hypothetical protein
MIDCLLGAMARRHLLLLLLVASILIRSTDRVG